MHNILKLKNWTSAVVLALVWFSVGCDNGSEFESEPSTSTTNETSQSWCVGGTLHRATMSEWKQASYRNRLATSGDMLNELLKGDGKQIYDMDKMKNLAARLETCISQAGNGGVSDSESVAIVAVSCYDRMSW